MLLAVRPAINRSVVAVAATVPEETVVPVPLLEPLPPAVRFDPSKGSLDASTLLYS